MIKFMNIVDKISEHSNKIATLLCIIIMSLIVVITFMGVVFRYVLLSPIQWVVEADGYLMVWGALIGASIGIRFEQHIGVKLFLKKFPINSQLYIRLIVNFLISLFVVIIILAGFYYAFSCGLNQVSATLHIPMFFPYMILPMGGAMILIQVFRLIVIDLFKLKKTYL